MGSFKRLGMRRLSWVALAWPLVLAPACGDSFEGDEEEPRCEGDANVPCNQDPWGCDEGQSCWIDNTSTFQCVNIGSAGVGDACQPVSGSSPCGQDLLCVATSDGGGICRRYCDPTDSCKTCDAGETCVSAMYPSAGNAVVQFCMPM